MNYLAHALLAEPEHERLIGNLAGDFVKGPLAEHELSPSLLAGVATHRRVDSYTDSHPVTADLRRLFSRRQRRYAGIILDIAFDHYLSRHWARFAAMPRREFIDHVYTILDTHRDVLPGDFGRVARRMIAGDWLGAYASLDGIERALRGVAGRLSRTNPLGEAIDEIRTRDAELEAGFLALFPSVQALCRRMPAGTLPI